MNQALKKQIRLIDLAVSSGRARQSRRTGFVHQEETIPLYDNFCFALALFRQKTAEAVTEGKELIERLLAFQAPDGNFPVFLHDYPRCFDFQMGLKIAPILLYLVRLFGGVLGESRAKIQDALQKALAVKTDKPQWENRRKACLGEPLSPVDPTHFSPAEWTEWLITAQLAGQTHFTLPYDPDLQLLLSPHEIQERGEPQPNPVEWLLADERYTPRLLRDHPHQLWAAPLFPITFTAEVPHSKTSRWLWKGHDILHSLTAPSLVFDLKEGAAMGLFEAAVYTDVSPETEVFVEGRKATTFRLGETVTVVTPTRTWALQFTLTQGRGDFCGHIFKANRPSQVVKGYECYDWQIGIRTLRRSPAAQITLSCLNLLLEGGAVDGKPHRMETIVDIKNSACDC